MPKITYIFFDDWMFNCTIMARSNGYISEKYHFFHKISKKLKDTEIY